MPIDLYTCVIALFSRMRVIQCCPFLLPTAAIPNIVWHTDNRQIHVHTDLSGPLENHRLSP